jgi:hypothetical protein
MFRFVTFSEPPYPAPMRLGSKWFTGDKMSLCAHGGKNYVAYDGFEDRAGLLCYYEYGRLDGSAVDSAFFPFGGYGMAFAIDSLGGKHALGERYGEFRLYITSKDITNTTEERRCLEAVARTSLNVSVAPSDGSVKIRLRLATAIEAELIVYDILGRNVLTAKRGLIPAGETEFNLRLNLSSGVYFLALESNSTPIVVSKFEVVR